MIKKNIPKRHQFKLPLDAVEVFFEEHYLIISPSTANWIVLENDRQREFFLLLKRLNIENALMHFQGDYEDAKKVVTQIVAKGFEDKEVESCVANDTKQLHLYITNGCNMKCPHCYMFSGQKNEDELTLEQIEYIIREYAHRGGKSITLSGGEVTTRKDFAQIVSFAHKNKLRVRILTNGVLWNEALVKEIESKIDSIQVSIDGYSEESNSIIRGKGSFIKALQTIDMFVKRKVSTELAVTIPYSSIGREESEQYIDFCNRMIAKYPKELFKIKIAEQLLDGREVHLNSTQDEKYSKFITSIRSRLLGHNSELSSFVEAFKGSRIMDNCMYGVFAIDSKGDVFFCARVSSLKSIGNIKDLSFDEIFAMSKTAQELSKIDNFKPCSDCSLKYICGGGCRIDYFPEFAKITDIYSVNFDEISERQCSQKLKERFYKLMIESNEMLYR